MSELEEFKKKLNLRYTFGMRMTDGASRRFSDPEMGIGAETHTSFNEKTHEWGKGETTYYFESSDKTHDSLTSLFEEYKQRTYSAIKREK